MNIHILIAAESHLHLAQDICDLIEASAKIRGTGIARREVSYIEKKILSGNAIIATKEDRLVGFCYIETWEHEKFVANSGLIIHPDFRKQGLARLIKTKAFHLAQNKYPHSKMFGITTNAAVMKINSELGYHPVTFSELTQDDTFWQGCQSCPNFDILQRNQQKICLCTAMLAAPKNENLSSKNHENS